MFYEPHEKLIYAPAADAGFPPFAAGPFDPLAVLRGLTLATGGRLADLLAEWQGAGEGTGDVSEGAEARAEATAATAEGPLVAAARAAFGLPGFPQCTDGVALDLMQDYLRWMEGKGSRGSAPPASPSPSA